MARIRENFRRGTVDDDPLEVAATTLNSTELADIPVIAAPDIYPIVLDPAAVHGNPEIVHITAHTASSTSATIARGEEGTTAREHPVDTAWQRNATADDFDFGSLVGTDLSGAALHDGIRFNGSLWVPGQPGLPAAVKTADETVNNSTTLQPDDELSFAVDANEVFAFLCVLFVVNASSTPNFKCTFTGPSGSSGWHGIVSPSVAPGGTHRERIQRLALGSVRDFGFQAGSENFVAFLGIILNGGTAGDLEVEWSQVIAHASDTDVLKDSYLDPLRLKP